MWAKGGEGKTPPKVPPPHKKRDDLLFQKTGVFALGRGKKRVSEKRKIGLGGRSPCKEGKKRKKRISGQRPE